MLTVIDCAKCDKGFDLCAECFEVGEHCKSNDHVLKKYYAWKYKRFVDKALQEEWCCSNPRCPYADRKNDFFFSECCVCFFGMSSSLMSILQVVSSRNVTKAITVFVPRAISSTSFVLWLPTICSKSTFADYLRTYFLRAWRSAESIMTAVTAQLPQKLLSISREHHASPANMSMTNCVPIT